METDGAILTALICAECFLLVQPKNIVVKLWLSYLAVGENLYIIPSPSKKKLNIKLALRGYLAVGENLYIIPSPSKKKLNIKLALRELL
ncbi:hypothetical protein QE152_g25638 [Popillia japonica]|uniref:Uncharacterized protein n=1 Tax=Popillia japonica TaxID=7064 RepID=A0AAW1K207_POPJA